MQVKEFAKITQNIIAKDGFDEFLPTAVYPNRRSITVLEGAPETSSIETAAFSWASEGAIDNEEFLVAFKMDATKFKVIRHYLGQQEFEVFDAIHSDA